MNKVMVVGVSSTMTTAVLEASAPSDSVRVSRYFQACGALSQASIGSPLLVSTSGQLINGQNVMTETKDKG